MADVTEVHLPGVGVRHDFVTRAGLRLGVLVHRTGRRELLVYGADDPDACRAVVPLDPSDTATLAELLGASQVSEAITSVQRLEGLAVDWLTVTPTSACAGATLRDSALRTETGVSIVAVIRDDQTIPAPQPDFVLQEGDVAVAVGTPAGIGKLVGLFRPG